MGVEIVVFQSALASIAGGIMDEVSPSAGYGVAKISLGDMLGNPEQALPQLQNNLMANWQSILVGSFATAFAFKTIKSVLRGPIGKVNRGLFGKRGIIGNVGFKL